MSCRALLLAAALAGCYEPPSASCTITCTTDCPDALSCVNGYCVADGETCDGTAIQFTQFSVGGRHVCGLDKAGIAYCWGDNRVGQLGVSTTTLSSARPVAVPGTWSAIAAGGAHTCALADGVAYCWGENGDGQALGMHGGTIAAPQRVQFGLAQPPLFTKIVTGGANSCALGDNQVWCWGEKAYVGIASPPDVAVKLEGENWTDVALGSDFGCGVAADGVKCWGANDDGQIGLPTAQIVTTPKKIDVPPGQITHLEAGTNNACVVVDGALVCWGSGKVMGGMAGTATPPTQLGDERGWSRVAVGALWLCGIRNGRAYCWGETTAGETGAGIWVEDRPRVAAADLGPADEIDVDTRPRLEPDERHACMRTGSQLRCWGDNSWGELGVGAPSTYETPVEVPAPEGQTWTRVTAGTEHVCGTLGNGAVLCWGRNDRGAVDPARPRGERLPCTASECDPTRPVAAPFATVDEVVAGSGTTCARQGATIHCWGDNYENRLGATNLPNQGPTTLTSPSPSDPFDKLLGGSEATCARLASTKVACWGNVASTQRSMPTLETSAELTNTVGAGVADRAACILRDSGYRVCWGVNTSGQLGSGTANAITMPAPFGDVPLRSISARYQTMCGVTTTASQIACWGLNNDEQAGVDGGGTVLSPQIVANLGGCTSVAVGGAHSCAVCAGKVSCWGKNDYGQLGRGKRSLETSRAEPIAVDPALAFTEVGATDAGGCALTIDGRIFCWGDSWRGQVGVGGSSKNLPTPVAGAL